MLFRSAANAASTKDIFIYDYTIMDGLALKASYTPSDGATAVDSSMDYGVLYTGVEGLSLDYAQGDTETIGSEQDHTTMKASYAYGSFTLGYSNTTSDYRTDADGTDEEITSYNIAYTVSDDLSVSFGNEEISTEEDRESTRLNSSHSQQSRMPSSA